MRDNQALGTAQRWAMPAQLHAPDAPGVFDYQALADELLRHVETSLPTPVKLPA